ncbi:hypothetical protein RB594_002286 [Gaeumannomyces avenae]
MAARKLQQEVDKCFKKVSEGVTEFEAIYEKIEQSTNPAQKEKLEDNLKREIKKLQRLRDQIKTWAASNDIKDKAPLLENRRKIETQMEKFKAVEKAMKTKAYSKEGLSAAAKLDPKEQAKAEASEFLGSTIDALELQIEALEAEAEQIQATVKKGKVTGAKAERMARIEEIIERHKWHQGKLELIRRSLENGGVETDQVTDLEESIKYYVSDGMQDDFMEDDTLYDDLALGEEEDAYGMSQDNDKNSSQDNQSVQEESTEDTRPTPSVPSAKPRTAAEASNAGQRRPSTQMKSPLPTLATLHTPLPTISNVPSSSAGMKPAPAPARPAGEGLKYASAAAAAAASDRNNVGIAPLPPPPGAPVISPMPPVVNRPSAANSPNVIAAQPAPSSSAQLQPPSSLTPQQISAQLAGKENVKSALSRSAGKAPATNSPGPDPAEASKGANGVSNGVKAKAKGKAAKAAAAAQAQAAAAAATAAAAAAAQKAQDEAEEESIYHLPASLRDLVESFEMTKKRAGPVNSAATLQALAHSQATQPDTSDADPLPAYQPEMRVQSSSEYPQEPLPIFADVCLYNRLDTDTLFYIFYYKQGTYQQFLAAKALKEQSWRFHKQYQTWFQRHEEPKNITEEFEQGTYRFFDYESTWMNRRKADFKFAYKYLEDDI